MDNNLKYKLLGMIAAAELQLNELIFDPREFLVKLKSELNSNSQFEAPSVINSQYYGFLSPDAVPLTC